MPGTSIPVSVNLTPHEEVKPREVRVELVGQEIYYVRQTYTDSKGHVHTRVVRKNNTFARIARTVAQQPVLFTGAEQRWRTTLAVPPDAPPTSKGKLVNISWTIKAVMDVPMRHDQSEEIPIQILSIPPQSGDGMTAEKIFDDCVLNLEAPFIAGADETLIGALVVQTKQNLKVRGIRVELIQSEDAGARKSEQVISEQQISGAVSLNPYESPSYKFALAIPAGAPPTAISPHSSLRWFVRATLDRRLRRDFNVQQQLLIYHAPDTHLSGQD